jgi:4,5-dihydroxyphthalate decarboxylase
VAEPSAVLRVALKQRPRTQALADGRVAVPGVRLALTDVVSTPERHRLLLAGQLDAAEMGLNALARYRAVGQPLVALPIYLKRGLAHSHVYVRQDSPIATPEALRGRRVGCGSYSPNILVGARALLQHQFRIHPRELHWLEVQTPEAGEPRPADVPIRRTPVPPNFATSLEVEGEEELDARTIPLGPAEPYLCHLLLAGEIDAVVNPIGLRSPHLRPLFPDDAAERAWLQQTGVYPINHVLACRAALLAEHPDLAQRLVAAFQAAADLAEDYGGAPLRARIAAERHKLGGQDPFRYVFGAAERRSVEAFLGYMWEQGILPRPLTADDLFDARRVGAPPPPVAAPASDPTRAGS